MGAPITHGVCEGLTYASGRIYPFTSNNIYCTGEIQVRVQIPVTSKQLWSDGAWRANKYHVYPYYVSTHVSCFVRETVLITNDIKNSFGSSSFSRTR